MSASPSFLLLRCLASRRCRGMAAAGAASSRRSLRRRPRHGQAGYSEQSRRKGSRASRSLRRSRGCVPAVSENASVDSAEPADDDGSPRSFEASLPRPGLDRRPAGLTTVRGPRGADGRPEYLGRLWRHLRTLGAQPDNFAWRTTRAAAARGHLACARVRMPKPADFALSPRCAARLLPRGNDALRRISPTRGGRPLRQNATMRSAS